jgi:drug/metabolite transporter, DME family
VDGPERLTRRPSAAAGAALIFGAASFWASLGIFTTQLYRAGFAPLELASVRAAVGFAAVALYALSSGERRRRTIDAVRGHFLLLAAYGILGYALFTLAYFAALERTSVAIAVALLYTAPAFVLIMSAVLWREHIGARSIAALLLVLAGVALVTGAAATLTHGAAGLTPVALLLGLAAGATYALYTVLSKIATERVGAAAALFWSFAFAAAVLALVAPPHAPFVRAPEKMLLLIGIGIVPTLIPYALYLRGLRAVRASTAAMLASIEPVVAALLAAALLNETLSLSQGAGIVMVVAAAVMIAARRGAQAPRRAEAKGDGR